MFRARNNIEKTLQFSSRILEKILEKEQKKKKN